MDRGWPWWSGDDLSMITGLRSMTTQESDPDRRQSLVRRRFFWGPIALAVALVGAGHWFWQSEWLVRLLTAGRVVESGIRSPEPNIFWLNNQTVLFQGISDRDAERTAMSRHDPLFLWTIGGTVNRYADGAWFPSRGVYCAANGEISYSIEPRNDEATGDRYVRRMVGPIGRESLKEDLVRRDSVFDGTLPANPIGSLGGQSCSPKSNERMKGRIWASDSRGEFLLDFGPQRDVRTSEQNIVLQQFDGSHSVEVPVQVRQVSFGCTRFDVLTNRFLVWNCGVMSGSSSYRGWQETGCRPYWWISVPNGHAERHCIPYGPWAEGSLELLPARDSVFFTSKTSSSKVSGLYRIEDNAARRMLSGIFENPTTSPDGCLVAFSYAPHQTQAVLGLTVAATDVCDEKARF